MTVTPNPFHGKGTMRSILSVVVVAGAFQVKIEPGYLHARAVRGGR